MLHCQTNNRNDMIWGFINWQCYWWSVNRTFLTCL